MAESTHEHGGTGQNTNPDLPETDPWIHIGDAAARMHVSVSTMRRWDKPGLLPANRTPGGQRRYRLSWIDSWLRDSNRAA